MIQKIILKLNPLIHLNDNIIMNVRLLDACMKNGVERVVYYGSTTGYPDTSEEMEFSLANSDARDYVKGAVDKFGKNNVGLDRAGNALLNRVNEYEKEFSKFKNAQ